MPTTRWQYLSLIEAKRTRAVWGVATDGGELGIFRFAPSEQGPYAGPLAANELIAASLARMLGLPVAELESAEVAGPDGVMQRGVVEPVVRAPEIATWQELHEEVKRHPEAHVWDAELLAALVVFDAWTLNLDRTGDSVLFWREPGMEKYEWRLGSHSQALYGTARKWKRGAWNAPFWEQLWRYYELPDGMLPLAMHVELLELLLLKIEALPTSMIEKAIRSVPRGFLNERERQFVKRLLLHRQTRLRGIIQRWLDHVEPS